MKPFVVVLLLGVLGLGSMMLAPDAHAFVFLPALILIPIAKVVGIVIAGASIPAVSIGALYSFLFKKSFSRAIISSICIVIVIALVAAVILRFSNPDRPWW
jgi:hypothetical protein